MSRTGSYADLPVFDDQGRNLADPHDRRGLKTAYISLLQATALERYVGSGSGWALDVGCGYGRMSGALRELGFSVVGLDPSRRVLISATDLAPEGKWCVGQLPSLPFPDGAFRLVLAQNLLRVLHLNGILHAAEGMPRVIENGGRLVVVDNIRKGHADFIDESWLTETFSKHGLRLTHRVAIRAARWWGIYFVRYGLIPRSLHEPLVRYELRKMEKVTLSPRRQYHNVLFIFEKAA